MKEQYDAFMEKIAGYMTKNRMIMPGEHILAGVSGGADSVCLLKVLKRLRDRFGYSLSVIHVEHGIRGEASIQDAAFVEELCRAEEIPFAVRHVDVPALVKTGGLSEEEAARQLRYEAFREECARQGAAAVFTAHHADDCAETMLFGMVRGTGVRGMGGIAPVRTAEDGQGGSVRICRPLLCVSRQEVELWLREREQDYRTDATNRNVIYARNRIRHLVIPELTGINSRAVEHMNRLAEEMRQISDYLDEQTAQAMECCTERTMRKNNLQTILLKAPEWSGLPGLIQRYAVLELLGQLAGSRKDIGSVHVGQVLGLSDLQVGRRVCLPYGLEAVRVYDGILLRHEETDEEQKTEEAAAFSIGGSTPWKDGWRFDSEVLEWTGDSEKIPEKTYTKWFDYDRITACLCVRSRRPGDRIQVNAAGGHKKIKNYFIDHKIPEEKRDDIPLVTDGNEVLWIVGERISEAYKVTDETRRVLVIHAYRGEENERKH